MKEEWPFVSILIASMNRRADLERCLESVGRQDYPKDRMEVVVVEETGSPKPIPGVKYFPIPPRRLGFGYARNQCVRRASHPILVFIDDDCVAEPDWLKELVRPLGEGVLGVAGAVKGYRPNAIGFCETALGFPGGGIRKIWESGGVAAPTRQLSTCNCLYRREAVEAAGFFQEKTLFSGEDYDLAQRVVRQGRCLYAPKAVVYHRPRGSLREIFKWFVRRGRSEVNLIRLKTHSLPHQLFYILRTSLLLRAAAAALVFALAGIPVLPGLAALAILYYGVNLWRNSFQLKMGGNRKTWLLTPIVKLAMDLGWDAGKAAGFLSLIRNERK